jgi:hypothetical protein
VKYKFLGKADNKFPNLITGKVYELYVMVRVGLPLRPLILFPFKCPYSSWETFYKNWQPVKESK